MDSTKNFIDAWVNTQNKLVDNLVDTSKKIQESISKGEIVEKSSDIYSKWFSEQQAIAENFFSKSKKPEERNLIKDWMEAQTKLSERWLSFLSSGATPRPKSQMEQYLENIGKMQAPWQNLFSFFNPTQTPNNLMFDPNNLTNFVNNTQTYTRMFEMWQPIYKMLNSNTMSADTLNKMMDYDKYREVIDSMFNFMSRDKAEGFIEQAQKYAEAMSNMTLGKMPFSMDNSSFGMIAEMSEQINGHLQKMMTPYIAMTPAGREKDIAVLAGRIQERYTRHYMKASEIQHMIYVTSQQAIEKVVGQLMEKAKTTGANEASFDDFYNVWVNTLEEDLIKLFGGEAFSKVLGDSLKIGLEIKTDLDKQMELMLAPLPVLPRSEADEMSETLHELKTKVRHLERQLKALQEEKKDTSPSSTAANKKTTATASTSTRKRSTTSRKTTTSKTSSPKKDA